MKKPTILLYACSVLLSFAASLILDTDDPRPQVRAPRCGVREASATPEFRSLARR